MPWRTWTTTSSRRLDALKEDGLYEDTIIIYNSDHGGVMPRSKRFLYSSGTHCPLIVRIPEKYKHLWPAEKPGMTVDRIVSFVDMPKTWLSLAGAEIPDTFQGTVFLGKGIEPEPEYHLSFRERADERCDSVRMIRDKQFAYYKNYMPYAPAGQYLAYLWKAPAAPAWEQHHREGKTDEITGRFFRPRVSEEFYDTVNDFDNVHNLIDDPEHQEKIAEMKQAMRKKQLELYDSGLLPESMRMRRAERARPDHLRDGPRPEALSARSPTWMPPTWPWNATRTTCRLSSRACPIGRAASATGRSWGCTCWTRTPLRPPKRSRRPCRTSRTK